MKKTFLFSCICLSLFTASVYAKPEKLPLPPTTFEGSGDCFTTIKNDYRDEFAFGSDDWDYRSYFDRFMSSGFSGGTDCHNGQCIQYFGFQSSTSTSPVGGGCMLTDKKFANYDFWHRAYVDLKQEVDHYNAGEKSLPITTYGVKCSYVSGDEAHRYDKCELTASH